MEITVNPEFLDIINQALENKINRHLEPAEVQSLEIMNKTLSIKLTNGDIMSLSLSLE
ncbi:MAG: hypothetical protein [Bacteriophage sp.]|jgi:hypothetical protein|nr:MAG: hypothetical protein [Bacteriophage sp.]